MQNYKQVNTKQRYRRDFKSIIEHNVYFLLKKLKLQQGRPLYAKLKAAKMTQEAVEASIDYNFGNIWENEVSPQNTPGLECFTITFL